MSHLRMKSRPRKAYRPMALAQNPVAHAMLLAAKIAPGDLANMLADMHEASETLRTGVGSCPEAWRSMADCVNVGKELMRYGLAPDHVQSFAAADAALKAVCDRANAGGSWTLRTEERMALEVVVLVHRVQLEACSNREFRDAVVAVQRKCAAALRGQGSATAPIAVVGRLKETTR